MSEAIFERDSAARQRIGRVAYAPIRYPVGLAALAGLYYGAAKTGYLLEFAGPVAAIIWLPVGVGIAFLYLGGLRYWPGVLIGDLLANNYTALPIGSALGQTCGNMLEVILAVVLLRRLVRNESPLASVRGVGAIFVATAAAAAVSATVGAVSLLAGEVIAWDEMPTVWRTWWLGDASGALIVVPLALAWYRPLPDGWRHRQPLEALALLGAVVGVAEFASRSSSPLMYLVFPVLIWAALTLRPARRDPRCGPDRLLHRLEHNPLRRRVPLRVGHPQRAQHPALHRRRCSVDALSGRGRQ